VAKYDEFDEDNDAADRTGKQSAWNLGLIRYLDPSTRLKLFYQINQEGRNDIDNNQLTVEFITLF
jgi:phosphate-selective porin